MIKCEVIENFTLEKFSQLKNVKKVVVRKDNEFGVKDTFECDKEMADYLLGNNILKKQVVKVIEVVPEVKEEPIIIVDTKAESENIVPLTNKEELDKLGKAILEQIKPKKKKSSKK